jgi:hypothetical protein
MKTSELTGAALDWAVAKCEGLTLYKDAMLNGVVKRGWWVSGMSIDPNTWHPLAMFNPSTNWSQGGPIIEREYINITYDDVWTAEDVDNEAVTAFALLGAVILIEWMAGCGETYTDAKGEQHANECIFIRVN